MRATRPLNRPSFPVLRMQLSPLSTVSEMHSSIDALRLSLLLSLASFLLFLLPSGVRLKDGTSERERELPRLRRTAGSHDADRRLRVWEAGSHDCDLAAFVDLASVAFVVTFGLS